MPLPRLIWEYFLLAHDRKTGEPIGAIPLPSGEAHFKLNVAPLWYVLSHVQEDVEPSYYPGHGTGQEFAAIVAYELSWAFKADVFGRAETLPEAVFPYWSDGSDPWILLAPANCQLCFEPLERGQKDLHPDCALRESHDDGEGGLS